ncbi:MAG TPA: hypothetical protein VMT46_06125, partial [Anaerolineaceae bacterium]|nr:hypothetical protein [Anaerolineaceae bacterium]
MDRIRGYLNKPAVVAAIAFVAGLLIGWIVLGWGLFPVTWTDATPKDLRQDLKVDYLRMAIDSYSKNHDQALAKERYDSLGPNASKVLAEVQANPENVSPADVLAFTGTVTGSQGGLLTPAATSVTGATQTPAGTVAAPAAPSGNRNLPLVLGVLCALLLIIAAALAYIFLIRGRGQRGGGTPASQATELNRQAERTDFAAQGQEAPVAQFMTTYMAGDDLYDDSFSIDSPSGEFLGECGVGISDTIGVGDPKKVTAFEVWLFDKNDIQTVTKVLMSQHAINDPTISARLESKGEPVLAEPGKRIVLETATLQLEARVV